MTFVKFDPESVQALINNLYAYVEDVDGGRGAIYWASEDRDHPVASVEEMTSASALYSCAPPDGVSATSLGSAGATLLAVADDLKARRQEIINLNSNGITAAAPDGRLTYYLPDDAEDTVANVRAYNTEVVSAAGADAAALSQATSSAGGTADDGRTVDQILADVAKYQDNPAYGAAFVRAAGGAEAYLDLVHDIDRMSDYPSESESAVSILGHVLGGASQPEVGGDGLGAQVASAIVQTPSADRTAVFNALTSQSDVVYGSGFLAGAADELMGLDPARVLGGTSYLSTQYSHDPMAGVLAAMGNNPRAALDYLGGDGSVGDDGNWEPDDKAQWRWEMLTSRSWGCDNTMPGSDKPTAADGLTAALAAASSFRNPAPADDGAVAKDAARDDAKATYASGRGLNYLSEKSWSKDDITETMKRNLAVVVANSSEEVAAAAANQKNVGTGGAGPSLAHWGVEPKDMDTMIFRLGDSQEAMAVVSTGVGDYHHRRIEEAMSVSDASVANLEDEYGQLSKSSSYLAELSRLRYEKDIEADAQHAADLEKVRDSTVGTVTSLAATIGGAGVAAFTDGAGAPLAYTSIVTVAKPAVTDAIGGMLGQLGASGAHVFDPDKSSQQPAPNLLTAQAYGDALNRGLLTDQGTLSSAGGHDWAVSHPDHPDAAPMVDIKGLTSDQADDMTAWKANAVTNGGDLGVLNGLDTSIGDGWVKGRDAASDARTG